MASPLQKLFPYLHYRFSVFHLAWNLFVEHDFEWLNTVQNILIHSFIECITEILLLSYFISTSKLNYQY